MKVYKDIKKRDRMTCEICGNDYSRMYKVDVIDSENRNKIAYWLICQSCYEETFGD